MRSSIEIKNINSSSWSDYSQDLQEFCESSENDTSPAAVNYHWTDWKNNLGSLMYALVIEKRYDSGFFNLLYEDKKLVAVSGCYPADWNDRVLIIGSRTYTHFKYRDRKWYQSRYLFPMQCQHAHDNSYQAAILSFNGYNRKLSDFFHNISQKPDIKKRMVNFYQTFTALPDWYTIKYTPQRIAVRLFHDTTWQYFHQHLCPPKADLPTTIIEPDTHGQE